jgi:histone-arginine methyltransferase CARM1
MDAKNLENNSNKKENSTCKSGINSSETVSVVNYFDFYSKLSNQQNMLQDYVRTQIYYNAITKNSIDFNGKTVLDVGTGTGILSLFSIQAGASHVYAVEGSSSINYAKVLIKHNNLENKITLINKTVEDLVLEKEKFGVSPVKRKHNDSNNNNFNNNIVNNNNYNNNNNNYNNSNNNNNFLNKLFTEKVDVIVSEPLGILLVNERMLESFLFARNHFLKIEGMMYPSSSVMHFIPFSDERLYLEQLEKVKFWSLKDFFKVDLSGLYDTAINEKLRQPIVEAYDPNCQ